MFMIAQSMAGDSTCNPEALAQYARQLRLHTLQQWAKARGEGLRKQRQQQQVRVKEQQTQYPPPKTHQQPKQMKPPSDAHLGMMSISRMRG